MFIEIDRATPGLPCVAGGPVARAFQGGDGLFINLETQPLHANEGNQTTRKGTSL
jgi:hypothetical protein